MSHNAQKHLAREGGRNIAYAETGNPESDTIVLFLHGLFGIGNASKQSPVIYEKGVHYIAPSLPGWGESSDVPPNSTFASCLVADMTALINHLHPNTSNLRLYIGGGSYGTVAAQILYGASYEIFPIGRQICGLLLVAPLSPFRFDRQYSQSLTWGSWFAIGPLANALPFDVVPRLIASVAKPKLRTVAGTEKYLRETLFDKMDAAECQRFAKWCESQETTRDEVIKGWAEDTLKSTEKTWGGFLMVSKVLHGDWGFSFPLDEDHSRGRVLIVSSTQDDLGRGMAEYLKQNYRNASLKVIEGGHVAAVSHFDEIWAEVLV